ncbi:hypothetical protein B0A48_15714 [Cryoendolithus antarcticus]|uniref:Uncharacterized protein n=1 Tax=Cryoendolithus antarcticus TaxID=1507870 RepID=A0A1V8SH15_9PEZI|nr:hypothetical protein B0A48_15714 [Cryoendolithus antarcticus]
MKLSTTSQIPVYTIAGSNTARPLPEWLARKRKRSLKKDAEYANRVELLQDFEFEEASSCVRVSRDGDWVMSTGTYKPQIHVHSTANLSLSFARHTDTVNQKFVLLDDGYAKSLHLQCDRSLEFHTPGGMHYRTRLPRYGRDLVYDRRRAEALVPSVGVGSDGMGEVYRLNLEVGRYMRSYEVDVGGDDFESMGGGALQGGIRAGAVNTAAVADESHGLLAFGTSIGTVEFWDPRSRHRVSVLSSAYDHGDVHEGRPEVTAVTFHSSGLQLATGSSTGIVHTYDMRSPVPLLRKDQGYGFPIHTLKYLPVPGSSSGEERIMSADKRIIKLWDAETGAPWTSVEPAVDINHVEPVPGTGMLLTANEGRQQHIFFIPQLGPAPKWCSFLDNMVEEMAEDSADPAAYVAGGAAGLNPSAGAVYDNYKFLSLQQLRELNLDHLVGKSGLLRPYMHGYFIPQRLYEQARLISRPDLFEEQRAKSVREKIDKERESRIRGTKKVSVKVNKALAERMTAKDEAHAKRKAERAARRGQDVTEPVVADVENNDVDMQDEDDAAAATVSNKTKDLMTDDRFTNLFQDEDFEIDETSREFAMLNPSTVPGAAPITTSTRKLRGLTAAEEEDLASNRSTDSDNSDDDDEDDANAEAEALEARQRSRVASSSSKPSKTAADEDKRRVGSVNYKKSGHQRQAKGREPTMQVSSSGRDASKFRNEQKSRSFGDLAARGTGNGPSRDINGTGRYGGRSRGGDVVGEKEVTFAPGRKEEGGERGGRGGRGGGRGRGDREGRGGGRGRGDAGSRGGGRGYGDRRSASNNVFRQM